MKKEYVKPEIYSEEFVISETVASDCTEPNFTHYSGSCSYADSGYTFFYTGTCVDDGETFIAIDRGDESALEGFCTYGPSVAAVFNS